MKMELQHIHIGEEEILSGNIQKLIEPLWFSVSIYDSKEKYDSDLAVFSLPQRYVFAAQWYFAEVYNGGHDQFFFNSTGIVWQDALNAFRAAGLMKCAEILEQAAKLMGGTPSFDREERWDVMEKLEPDFDKLDRMLYDLPDEDTDLRRYIFENKEAFYYDGDIELPVY